MNFLSMEIFCLVGKSDKQVVNFVLFSLSGLILFRRFFRIKNVASILAANFPFIQSNDK
jgi:hypothetical protein